MTIDDKIKKYQKLYGIMIGYDLSKWQQDRRTTRYYIEFPYGEKDENGIWHFSWKNNDRRIINNVRGNEITYYVNLELKLHPEYAAALKAEMEKQWKDRN